MLEAPYGASNTLTIPEPAKRSGLHLEFWQARIGPRPILLSPSPIGPGFLSWLMDGRLHRDFRCNRRAGRPRGRAKLTFSREPKLQVATRRPAGIFPQLVRQTGDVRLVCCSYVFNGVVHILIDKFRQYDASVSVRVFSPALESTIRRKTRVLYRA